MNIILEILLFIALFSALFLGAGALYSNSPILQTQVGHIQAVFNFIVGNLNNIHQFFPVYDLLMAFGAVILIEIVVFIFKITNYFIKFKK